MLQDEPWRGSLPHQGVRILGAVFGDDVVLDNADLDSVLWLEDCRFEREVFLSQTKAKRLISFDRSTFLAPVHLNAIRLDAGLFLREVVANERIELWGTSIAGPLFLSGSRLDGIFLQQAHVVGDVVANAVNIGYLQLGNATFDGSIVVGPGRGRPSVLGQMRAETSRIAGRIAITDATIKAPLLLRFASLGGNLEISGGILHGLDLTGATIAGDIILGGRDGRSPPTWADQAPSVLRNATARVIRIAGEPWPPRLDLRGFQFQLLGGGGDGAPGPGRPLAPLLQWLGRSEPYSPQPYQQVARVLETSGDEAGARQIRYAAREVERRLAGGWKKIWLTAEWLVIGHGYHLERTLYWVLGLLVAGVLVVRLSGEAARHDLGLGLAFSFDRLVPVITLRDRHAKVELRPGVRQYFYVHQILGYVLASFLLAGLSGLTR